MAKRHKRIVSDDTNDAPFSHFLDDRIPKQNAQTKVYDFNHHRTKLRSTKRKKCKVRSLLLCIETVSNLANAGQLTPQYFANTKIDIFAEVYSKLLEKYQNQQDSLIDNSESSWNDQGMEFKILTQWSLLNEQGQEVEGESEDQFEFEMTVQFELTEPFRTADNQIISNPEAAVLKRCSIFEK